MDGHRADTSVAALADLLRMAIDSRHTTSIRVVGNSMHPTLKDGCMIRVEPIDRVHIRRGDIVVWHRSEGGVAIIVHRVVKSYRKEGCMYVVTKGDHYLNTDWPVRESDIVGRVRKDDFLLSQHVYDRIAVLFNLIVYPLVEPVVRVYLWMRSVWSSKQRSNGVG